MRPEPQHAPSTTPVVRPRIVAIAKAATWPVGPDRKRAAPFICLGYPGKQVRNEYVSVGDVRSNQVWSSMPKTRSEKLEVKMQFMTAFRNRTDLQAQDRVYALIAVMEQEFRDDPTLGITESTHNGMRVVSAAFTQMDYFSVTRSETVVGIVDALVLVDARI